MNPKYVTSLERSKSLHDLGVRVKSEFYWCDTADKRFDKNAQSFRLFDVRTAMARRYNTKGKDIQYPAYISEELMEILPKQTVILKGLDGLYASWLSGNLSNILYYDTIPNALAQMVETGLREKWLDLKAINGGKQ